MHCFPGSRSSLLAKLENGGADALQREEPPGRAAGVRGLRHAEDDGALLVLGVRRSAGALELEQTLGAVVAHAGQHEPRRARAVRARQRDEQLVARGTVQAGGAWSV